MLAETTCCWALLALAGSAGTATATVALPAACCWSAATSLTACCCCCCALWTVGSARVLLLVLAASPAIGPVSWRSSARSFQLSKFEINFGGWKNDMNLDLRLALAGLGSLAALASWPASGVCWCWCWPGAAWCCFWPAR